jgi:hypothetical protein
MMRDVLAFLMTWKHGAPWEWATQLVRMFPCGQDMRGFYADIMGRTVPPDFETSSLVRWVFGVGFKCRINHVAVTPDGIEEVWNTFEEGTFGCCALNTTSLLDRAFFVIPFFRVVLATLELRSQVCVVLKCPGLCCLKLKRTTAWWLTF